MKFRLKASEQVLGFLDKGTTVTGELEFAGMLRIDGNFHGSISTTDTLIIGEHAIVNADVKVGEIEIHGQVSGTIDAKRRVEISSTGRVRGEIQTPVLLVNPGGIVDGQIRMADNHPEGTFSSRGLGPQQGLRQERHG